MDAPRAGIARFLPTLSWVRAFAAPAAVLIATSLDRNYQTDFWHHLARGRALAMGGGLADTDSFTFTVAGQAVRDANWLTQLLYFRLFSFGELPLVQFVNSLTLTATLGLLVWLCQRVSGSLGVAAAVGALVFLGLWETLLIRPQTFSLLLFVTLYAVLDASARRRWMLVLPPVLLALWANVHGGFPIGLVLIAAFTGAAFVSRFMVRTNESPVPWSLLACFIACTLATLINPYGWRVYEYAFTLSATAASRGIEEWLPPGLSTWTGRAWALSVLVVVALFALSRRRPTVREVCLAVFFFPLACGSVRMVAWWMLAMAPVVASLFADGLSRRRAGVDELSKCPPRPSIAAGGAFGAILLLCVLSLPWLESSSPVFRTGRSTHRTEADLQVVTDHLLAQPGTGRVYARLEWGEYLAWSAWPACRVFMDGRIEIYPDEVWSRYAAVSAGRADWEEILDASGVDHLLLDRTYHGELLPQVTRSDRWTEAARSGPAVLFVRRTVDPDSGADGVIAGAGN